MGIEQFDFLYKQAQTMLEYFNSISINLNNVSQALDSAIVQATAADVEGAVSTISGVKTSIGETGQVITQAAEMVNALIPLITQEVEKYYDGKTTYNYRCEECSIRCPLPLKYIPLDQSVLKTCLLKGDKSASFYQESITTSQ